MNCAHISDDLFNELSMCLQRQLVLVSPFTLKMANIAINDKVIIDNGRGYSSLRTAWPHMVSNSKSHKNNNNHYHFKIIEKQ